ncbi:heme-binding protein [Candidatus Viadribacter manganicus]|uniref:Heme-binding protein n=2 Tax=Candidatus Viadribacter manganicus TaxID=1759059 RepID=A0A1B1AH12_9PROT|nr:heme-binding protein [Candidatus Viadribacter manganicus]
MRNALIGLLCALFMFGGEAMATEEPAFTVAFHEGDFEVRDYSALVVAEVSVSGSRDEASNAGFRLLAGYIFGGNTRRQSIAMTAPVVQERASGETIAMTAPVTQSGEEGAWIVRFTMPANYTLETLPTPNDARVRLVPMPAARYAVVRFSGLSRPADVERRTEELRTFIARQQLRAAGPASLARYNPPWTLWFMRRNEVWIPVLRTV